MVVDGVYVKQGASGRCCLRCRLMIVNLIGYSQYVIDK